MDGRHVNNGQPELFVKKDHRNSVRITVVLCWSRGELNSPKIIFFSLVLEHLDGFRAKWGVQDTRSGRRNRLSEGRKKAFFSFWLQVGYMEPISRRPVAMGF